MSHVFLSTVDSYLLLTSLKVCDWSRHIFGASASPRSFIEKTAMSPSSTVHGSPHDTNYMTFELLMHAAFVADEIWGSMLGPARTRQPSSVYRSGVERLTPRASAAAAPPTTCEPPVNPAGGQTPRTTTVGSALRRWTSAGQRPPDAFIRESLYSSVFGVKTTSTTSTLKTR